MKITVCI